VLLVAKRADPAKHLAAWTEGATHADVDFIAEAMEHSPHMLPPWTEGSPTTPLGDPEFATNLPPGGGRGDPNG
jgi:hypothetical protein